jgi:N utilization substance protein B
MLNRRHIREKVLKTLYAFFQADHREIRIGENELFHSIDKVYDMYLMYLSLVGAFQRSAENLIQERKQKHLPTAEDLNPSLNFVNNALVKAIEEHSELQKRLEKSKIGWADQGDLVKKHFMQMRNHPNFLEYLAIEEPDLKQDRDILVWVFEEIVFPSESIEQLFEERSIYWLDEIGVIQAGVLKTIRSIKPDADPSFELLPLHKEAEADRVFATDLFRKTIAHSEAFEKEIASRTQNWEIERVAKMDMILMKMAITELTAFPSIPVKVTLDEYIELSKDYSSPQSKNFINGILDKIVADFRRDEKIVKTGRGLVE